MNISKTLMEYAQKFVDFVNKSPTAFHGIIIFFIKLETIE